MLWAPFLFLFLLLYVLQRQLASSATESYGKRTVQEKHATKNKDTYKKTAQYIYIMSVDNKLGIYM